jgi:hypothetical protein
MARVTHIVLGVAVALLAVAVVIGGVGVASASAATPAWKLASNLTPTDLPPGGEGEIVLLATNLGDGSMSGQPVTISDSLPAGLTVKGVSFFSPEYGDEFDLAPYINCTSSSPVTCTFPSGFLEALSPEPLRPYQRYEMDIVVNMSTNAPSGEVNEASVEGGSAASVSVSKPVMVSASPPGFGIEDYEIKPENEDGSIDTQAGSHPFQLTTTFALNKDAESVERNGGFVPEVKPPALDKDLHFELPPGLVGNPTVSPQCTELQFTSRSRKANGEEGVFNDCPDDTVMGVAQVTTTEDHFGPVPLFNLVPSAREPARFGFEIAGNPVILDTSVRTGGDYGVVASVNNVSQTLGFLASQVTFWGVPGDPRHDQSRGWSCLTHLEGECTPQKELSPQPFLTLPTSCTNPVTEPFTTTLRTDSWAEPSVSREATYKLQNEAGTTFAMDGCNRLSFEPSISVAPDGQAASTPTGLAVNVHVPQESVLTPSGLADSDVKKITVALPAGVSINPAGGDGLQACSDAQIGFTGVNPQSGIYEFTPGAPSCPETSKIGTVKIKTPLLPNALEGAVYLAAPQNFAGPLENPFGSLVAMYIVAEDPVSGVLVKLAGRVTPDPVTGQLTATFESPQLPFENAELHFFGSARAPLSTPPLCGTYTTQASIEPWSGNAAASASSSFEITSGPDETPCQDPRPFTPGFQAGSLNLQAGAFTPFELTMTRPDADQTLSQVELQMPRGLLGTLSTVKLCPEPQAALGTCGPESLIGETTVSAGLGNDPYTVTGGKVYITTGYKGAPYGLSIVNPAKAGPFDLGTVVVRATINVDPHTAALTIKSDPLPTIIDGIPLQIQHVNVSVDREKFTFNPTGCNKTAIKGTLSSTEGVAVPVSTSFQVTNCATLAFKPKFTASTSGKTSRANGASLHVKLSYPEGPYDANIAKVKVDLPKQLPSRLTTLQKACPAAVFDANPANCPKASIVATAKAITPVLPVPLTGPAYFVSHGGEAFPDLVVVLQGYGVTVDLVGTTFISKAGITSSTFKTVPDVPVGTFELTLPEGKYSALAANGNLCTSKLAMPTAFVGQNGAEIHQSTPITATGCAKHKKTKSKNEKTKSKSKKK